MTKLDRYTPEASQALSYAREEALRLRQRSVGPEHLLLGLLRVNDPLIEGVFSSQQVGTLRVFQALELIVGRGNKLSLADPTFNAAARIALSRAEEESRNEQTDLIGIEHLLLGILRVRDSIEVSVLESFGMYLDVVRQQIVRLTVLGRENIPVSDQFQARYNATPTLNQVSRDVTAAVLAGTVDPMIGRVEELDRTMQILARRSKNNPVLIGPAGVGKTAIAEGLAQRIIQGHVPESLLHCRVVALDVGLLTVGTKFRGDFEERLQQIKQEIINAKDIIIVIDELHVLVKSGVAEGSIDAANLFKPMLARGEFRCIGATTLDDYRKTIESDPALERRFQPVQVRETTAQETLEIVQGLRERYADFHHVRITDKALVAAVQMSSRYIQSRFQPDKAIDLVDEAAARIRVQQATVPDAVRELREDLIKVQRAKDYAIGQHNFIAAAALRKREIHVRQALHNAENAWYAQQREDCPLVSERDIADVVAMWTGIPVAQIASEEAERLLKLEDKLHQRVIGQHDAVQAIAKAVRRSRTNLRDSHRPIGSFLFVGPTGVGKTELARVLAEALFGDENALFKLDMSEFMESHQVARLIGAPPGYVGYDSAGQLTEVVRRSPYSVVLFDEVEKAHPKVFDLLLQVLEEGRLTDSHGQTVDFSHTIVIITSNIGTAQLAQREISFLSARRTQQERQASAYERMRSLVMPALKDTFKPELLNRIDEIVMFHTLEQVHLREIVDLMVGQTQQRLAARTIELQVSDEARQLLVERGYDAEYGARPLRRTVQRMLEDVLAEALLQGKFAEGDAVHVGVVGERLDAQPLVHVSSPSSLVHDEREAA